MVFNIKLTSDNIGSNPGGRCNLKLEGRDVSAYIKYCTTNGTNGSSLTPMHQPIYEALTLELAKKLGLHTPNYRVLCNKNRDVRINIGGERTLKRFNEKTPFYFVSKLINIPDEEDEIKTAIAMKEEKVYRDLLGISDVSGRKQNFVFVQEPGHEYLLYIDLGCSFVNAHKGKITLSNLHKKGLKQDRKAIKRKLKKFSEYWVDVAQNGDALRLSDIIQEIPLVKINLLNSDKKKDTLEKLLSEAEVRDIQKLHAYFFDNVLTKHKGTDKIVRI